MIITEVNAFVQLVTAATKFASQLQNGWYKGSVEVEKFQQQVKILCNKHDQWSAQLHRHGLSEENRLLQAAGEALQVLENQLQYVTRLQKNRLLRWRRKAFPGQLSLKLENVLAMVDEGPQLVERSVAHYDLLERRRAQTPAPLPFVPDPKYVPISESIEEIRKALETPEGSRVVTVYGGPGLGKSSAAKYLALQYAEERKSRSTPTFPDGVYYLFCGQKAQKRVDQLVLDLIESLGFGASSSAPTDSMAGGVQEGQYFQQPSPHLKLRSRLFEQKLLIILDDLWEGDVLEQLLVPAQGVKYFITSQIKEIWRAAKKIRLLYPTMSEARHIMANYTEGLPSKGEFPDGIQGVIDDIIRKLDYHPLSLANVGISINEKRVNDDRDWKAIRDDIYGLLDDAKDLQDCPEMYDKRYSLTVGASMMLMVESLPEEARRLLLLMALFGRQRVPETLVRLFYQVLQGSERPDFLRRYNNEEKYLEDRSLVTLDVRRDDEINTSILAAHELRMHYIRQNNSLDLQALARQILPSSDQGVELIRNGDAEETLVTVLSALYYEQSFTSVVVPTLEHHLRIINDGLTIPRSIHSRTDTLTDFDQVRKFRRRGSYPVRGLVYLLDVDNGETAWKQQARDCAKKIIIKLACQGQLDDCSMATLIQLPQTTSTACSLLDIMTHPFRQYILSYGSDIFSSAYPTTMKALLTLIYDDATSTRRRIAAVDPLLNILDFEGKDNILKVGPRLTMDSNPTLQIALAGDLTYRWAIGKYTEFLEVLIGLLVSAKDYELIEAGRALLCFAQCKFFALKIVIIPDALANLFDLFLSKTKQEGRSTVGKILATLASVPENRSKFRGMKGSVEGVGDILATLGVTWQASRKTGDLYKSEQTADWAAAILGALALDEELNEIIALLPGLEEGLLFLQVIQMAHLAADPESFGHHRRFFGEPISSTKALTILFSNPRGSTQSYIPAIGELEAHLSDRGLPSKISRMADTYVIVYWTRVIVHLETRAYKEALENFVLAQNHLCPSKDKSKDTHFFIMTEAVRTSSMGYDATIVFSEIGVYVRAMLNDYAGALLATNSTLDELGWKSNPLIERGIVKRLAGDLQGALDDFNSCNYENVALLKNRGYVKHLMGDDTGARQDAKAAQRQKLKYEMSEKSIDFTRLWLLQEQPINYLGYNL